MLGYVRWENFSLAIKRAIESCKAQGINIDDHFREVTKMIKIGKGGKRPIQNFMLTRYTCYLIAQNGDPKRGKGFGEKHKEITKKGGIGSVFYNDRHSGTI